MSLLTLSDLERLHLNGRAQRTFEEAGHPFRLDFPPVVKLISAGEWRAWSLASIDMDDPDLAYGLFDGDDGLPHVGHVRLSDLEAHRDPSGHPLHRVSSFEPQMTLFEYAAHYAQHRGNTVLSPRF